MKRPKDDSANILQIYEYSTDLISRAKKAMPILKLVPNLLLGLVLKHFVVCIGYLDGSDSPKLNLYLEASGDVTVSREDSGDVRKSEIKISEILSELQRVLHPLNAYVVKKMVRIADSGEGVHFGGWLPMGTLSDTLGRPLGSKYVHVIDSSILPTVESGPITFTVMANAVRIANQVSNI